jgi:HAD superfamily hydrolase (TIGR01509 family)
LFIKTPYTCVMIKLVIFDLDGVLVDSCDLHFDAFNLALNKCGLNDYQITHDEHLKTYNGKPTLVKLRLLSTLKGLDTKFHNDIYNGKQDITHELIQTYTHDNRIINILQQLKENLGVKIFCASNSIWTTLKTILLKKGLLEYMDYIISNEDVKYPKPHPEIYYSCLKRANVSPNECLIIEDSDVGFAAATASGAHVLRVSNTQDVTYDKIFKEIQNINPVKKHLNVVIPMAGNGSRFAEKGYINPKPLIPVYDKPMIQWVVDNLRFQNENVTFIFITRQEHRDKYNLDNFLNTIAPNCHIVSVDKVTEGAACTVLLAKQYINNQDNLILANSDQFLEWNQNEFLQQARSTNVDGLISTFEATHPKWSYAKEENGFVSLVAEKNPISNKATTGIYFWKKGSDFVQFAESMISKNIRVNNEFYVCPVFNEAIQQGKKITTQNCHKMWGLGTPDDLNYFLEHYNMT